MALEGDIARLSAVPFLAELGPEALRLIAFSAETRIFRAGDVMFRRGETSDGGFLVLVGSVALEGQGNPPGTRQVLGPGALIGQRALISALPRPATATAREPTTVLKITRRLFHRVLGEFPDGAERLRAHIARTLHDSLSGRGS